MKIAIIAIGTEVSDGQITNRNATTLAARLTELGGQVVWHCAVPDERALMLSALNAARREASCLVLCGGLGPTTDDFTRDVVAEWLGLELVYDEGAWAHIVARFEAAGFVPSANNRQQCYFPKGADILENSAGTAHGFRVKNDDCDVWVLPGPPREIDAIWQFKMQRLLADLLGKERTTILRTWTCLGYGESALAEIVENVLAGRSLKLGYRAHRPFVEVKVWHDAAQHEDFGELEKALAPWLWRREGDLDDCEQLRHSLSRPVEVIDEMSCNTLRVPQGIAMRLTSDWRCLDYEREDFERALTAKAPTFCLWTAGASEGAAWAGLVDGARVEIARAKCDFSNPYHRRWPREVLGEMVLRQWREWVCGMSEGTD